MPHRLFIGLSVGSGLEAADAAVVRAAGVGLDLAPRVERSARVPFAPAVRGTRGLTADGSLTPADLTRAVADAAVQAVRAVVVGAGAAGRDLFAIGLLDPARPATDVLIDWPEVATRVAEQTGLTVVHGLRGRDRAAGGTGHPITAAADYLLFKHDHEDRLFVHLGAATAVLLLPAGAKVSAVLGFDAGPGLHLLDALLYHGSRGRDPSDPGGKKAVQGRCVDTLLARWLEHPYLTRTPPKALHADAFGKGFLHAAFDSARQLGAALPDLLCTTTHLIARSVGGACGQWFPPPTRPRRVFLTGAGVQNGFLWQLLAPQFEGMTLARSDEAGVSAASRNAAAAAVLAALTCDGVAGNLPVLTGAAGGRLLGNVVPGDARNWARCAGWIADQTGDTPRANRAA